MPSSFLTNNRGSAFIIVLTIAIVLGLFALYATTRLVYSSKFQAVKQEELDFSFLLKNIKAQISDPQICSTLLLQGQNFDPAEKSRISLGKFKLNNQVDLYDGTKITPRLELLSVEVVPDSSDPAYNFDIQVNANVPRRLTYKGNLLIQVRSVTGRILSNTPGSNKAWDEIPIFVNQNTETKQIASCYGPNTTAHFCEQLGGAWNEAEANPLLRCNPNIRCFTRNLLDPALCKAPYTTTLIGITTASPIYLCQWCNDFRL